MNWYAHLPLLMIDHNVMRLDITVHDSLAVAEIEGLQELEDVKSNINIVELGVQASEIGVVDELEDKGRRFALGGECPRRGASQFRIRA